ncbi:MAG TPA: extracellular solute-binding protein [Pseudolabrys sp.]|nr:extracellular solute-binding protein [Pseudolabrys sp.]
MASRTNQTSHRINSRLVASLLSAFILTVSATLANADEIHVLSGGGSQVALRAFIPEFERATGHRVSPTFAHVSVIQQKLAAGEKADLILLPVPLIAAAGKTLPLRSEGRVVLARVGIAVIVRTGTTPPDISTSDAVRKMLLDARSVELPPSSGPAGGHLARMIEQFGIAEAVRPKLTIKAAIDGGAKLVAEGKVDVAMQLLSEVQSANGVTVVGLLPPGLQNFVVYGAAIPAANDKPEAALAFVKFLSEPGKKDLWKAAGFELMSTAR